MALYYYAKKDIEDGVQYKKKLNNERKLEEQGEQPIYMNKSGDMI